MRIHRNLLWLSYICGCVLFWYVLFRYGSEPQRFWYGLRQELSDGLGWLSDRIEKKDFLSPKQETTEKKS